MHAKAKYRYKRGNGGTRQDIACKGQKIPLSKEEKIRNNKNKNKRRSTLCIVVPFNEQVYYQHYLVCFVLSMNNVRNFERERVERERVLNIINRSIIRRKTERE